MLTPRTKAIILAVYTNACCPNVACTDCGLHNDPLCEDTSSHDFKVTCRKYMEDHPEEFTPEDIAEVLL